MPRIDPRVKQREEDVYHYIVAYCMDHHGQPPSYREISSACNLRSTSMVTFYVKRLVAKGFLSIMENRARSIHVRGALWRPPHRCPVCKHSHDREIWQLLAPREEPNG